MIDRRAVLIGLAAALAAPRAVADELNFAAAARYSAERRGVSMLVMQEGEILFEDYPNGGAPVQAHELASGTKSFSGIMAAAAAADGLLTLDELCAETLGEWRGDGRKSAMTIRHLLTLTGGLTGPIGRAPPYAEAIEAKAATDPGARFAYGPVPFQCFGEIMRRKLAMRPGSPDPLAYLTTRVLEPMGVEIGSWKRGRDSYPVLPHGAALDARNWARFGQSVYDASRGRSNVAGLDPAVLAACFDGTRANPGYGLTWWLLRPGLKGPGPRAGVDESIGIEAESEDVVMAAGAGNQRLYLARARNLIVVRQATGILKAMRGDGAEWNDAAFLRSLLT